MATTLPMLGETLPRTPAGLRPICVHVCARECTRAQAFMERTMEKSLIIVASFGMRPLGNRTPLVVVGLNVAGVVPFRTLRSKMSVWLGAPASRMKMTFFALFCIFTGVVLMTVVAGRREASQEAVTPVPAMLKKRRRVRWGRVE